MRRWIERAWAARGGFAETGGFAKTRWAALAAALGVVLVVFPDVVFLRASLQSSQLTGLFEPQQTLVNLIPETADRKRRDGYRDLAAATLQLEPAHEFMRLCLRDGESPYWNPYSGAGTHGPERLASVSFSAMTLASAALGAGSRGLHLVLLATFAAAVYCLYRALTVFLGCSGPAAVAGCFAFLLAGFHTSMIGAQMVRPYLLAPILLHALLAVVARPSRWRFVGAVLASSLMLAETFLPTTELVLICVHGLCLAYGVRRWRDLRRDGLRQLAVQGGVSVLGWLLVAPLWFPILESLPLVNLGHYEERTLKPARPWAALSMVTPKHFWESYNAFDHSRGFTDKELVVGRIESTRVYHLGLVALFVAAQALAAAGRWRRPVVLTAAGLMAIAAGRTFGVPPFSWVGQLPVLDAISLQYWGAGLCFPFCILLAHGFDALSAKTVWRWPTLTLGAALAVVVTFVANRIGIPESGPAGFDLRVGAGLVAAVVVTFAVLRWRPGWRGRLAFVLLVVMVGEWIFYMNRLRPVRREIDFDEVAHVGFLRSHLGDGRILNVGGRGLPANWGSALELAQIDSLDAMNLRWYAAFFDRRFGNSQAFQAIRFPRSRDRPEVLESFDFEALDLLGVRYLVVEKVMENYLRFFADRGLEKVFDDRRLSIFENRDPYPRTFAAGGLIEAPGIPADHGLPGRHTAVSEDPELLRLAAALQIPSRAETAAGDGASTGTGTVRIAEYHNARVVLEASLERPAVVVLADVWHPSWRATVDGEAVHLGRVDEVLRGVAVAAGRHSIEMRYRPRSLPAAIFVAGLVAVLLAAWAAAGGDRRPHFRSFGDSR